jgi:hypothetical protein
MSWFVRPIISASALNSIRPVGMSRRRSSSAPVSRNGISQREIRSRVDSLVS